jgi:hypothetical protein
MPGHEVPDLGELDVHADHGGIDRSTFDRSRLTLLRDPAGDLGS